MPIEDYKDKFHRCFRCGYCKYDGEYADNPELNCPAYNRFCLETYSPGGRLWLINGLLKGRIEWTEHLSKILYTCTACGNCLKRCRFEFANDVQDMILSPRDNLVEMGLMPPEVRDFLENIYKHGNPWGTPRTKRGDWIEGTAIKHYKQGDEFLYYVGCVGSYDTIGMGVAKSFGELLLKSGFSFGVLGNDEECDGNEVKLMGEDGLFQMLAEKNIQRFKELGVKKIVTLSPHSYNVFKNEYPKHGGNFEVIHYTQLLRKIVRKVGTSKGLKARVTYHDPCFLGRHNEVYDIPRKILRKIPGVELVEMKKNRENSFCCGGGGGNFCLDFLGGDENDPSRVRIREAHNTGAEILVVSCPTCMLMLEDALKVEGLDDELAVKDISEIVRESCKS